jgi:hypothetical protein
LKNAEGEWRGLKGSGKGNRGSGAKRDGSRWGRKQATEKRFWVYGLRGVDAPAQSKPGNIKHGCI